jgi:hypothetical protein
MSNPPILKVLVGELQPFQWSGVELSEEYTPFTAFLTFFTALEDENLLQTLRPYDPNHANIYINGNGAGPKSFATIEPPTRVKGTVGPLNWGDDTSKPFKNGETYYIATRLCSEIK